MKSVYTVNRYALCELHDAHNMLLLQFVGTREMKDVGCTRISTGRFVAIRGYTRNEMDRL